MREPFWCRKQSTGGTLMVDGLVMHANGDRLTICWTGKDLEDDGRLRERPQIPLAEGMMQPARA